MQYTLHLGDTMPKIEATLREDGAVYDLTAATSVTLRYRLARGTVVTEKTCVIDDAAKGEVSYTWQAGDITEPGNYLASWRVDFPGGARVTWPNSESWFAFTVTPAL
jgi:hypothetical protein